MNFTLSCPRIILMIGDDGVVVVPFEIADTAPFFVPTDDRHALPEIFDLIARHPQAQRYPVCRQSGAGLQMRHFAAP